MALRRYGVGIDTHSRFINVVVLTGTDGEQNEAEKELPTTIMDPSGEVARVIELFLKRL